MNIDDIIRILNESNLDQGKPRMMARRIKELDDVSFPDLRWAADYVEANCEGADSNDVLGIILTYFNERLGN